MLITPFDPPDRGGEARLPRLLGRGPSSGYLEDHSLPPRETGDNGALRPLTLMVGGGEESGKGENLMASSEVGSVSGL